MKTNTLSRLLSPVVLVLVAAVASAALPPPTADYVDWPMPWGAGTPGTMSAAAVLDKPAGGRGTVVARDGHFYTGDRRLRFWGANIAFGGNFPTHEQADAVAERLAAFGINAVRFHHMDMQPYPTGIFADAKLEALSPEALDRLDYFVAALKKQGVWADLNLHVSRNWSKTHKWVNADQLPEFDKMVDVFHPDLIAPNKQFARDLLTHVNAYTHNRYADEPAVAVVEINNEDTLFLWGGEQKLAEMPQPYAGLLQKLWNDWLTKKYGGREQLKAAWAGGEQPLGGASLLRDETFSALDAAPGERAWVVEQHGSAKLKASADRSAGGRGGVKLEAAAVDDTSWHLQFGQGKLKLKKGRMYTLRFSARAEKPVAMSLGVSQAHEPWQGLGLNATPKLTAAPQDFRYGFVAAADDDNARVSFSVGWATGTIYLSGVDLREGGREGLGEKEDPAEGGVTRGSLGRSETPARAADWYDFLQQTDEAYWVEMRRFLRDDLGVKCPITGTIGLGPLGTRSQASMDFVDAHAYWEHPHFPRRQWDMKDWVISNRPMADNPAGATLFELAATRVAGKPFTVTEYNHAAPNEWQAECLPMVAAYAALQDWDGIFLFAYSHNNHYDKGKMDGFFDVEGNPLKMNLSPAAARIFLGQGVEPLRQPRVVQVARAEMLAGGSRYYYQTWPFVRDTFKLTWKDVLATRFGMAFGDAPGDRRQAAPSGPEEDRIAWTAQGPDTGTGRFVVRDPHAAVFAGFAAGAASPIDLGAARVEALRTPFAVVTVVPADPRETIESAARLLVTAVGRGENTGMKWDAKRTSVSDQWGKAPPRVEVVKATLSVAGKPFKAYALTPEGKRDRMLEAKGENGRAAFDLGTAPTMWYELVRD